MTQQVDADIHAAIERSGSLHSYLVAHIRDLIVRGTLDGGARIPEAQLCKRLDVSRTPLREALKALSVEGLVILQPNRGAWVAPLDAGEIWDVFEAKGAIEHFIGLNAAMRATNDDIHALEKIHARLEAAETTARPDTYTELNETFHHEMARLAGNAEILRIYRGLQSRILRARHRINHDPDRVRASLEEHNGIIVAMAARARFDLAERLVAHNSATADAVTRELKCNAQIASTRDESI